MNFSDYCKAADGNRRILIATDAARANSLLRSEEKKNGVNYFNICCKSLKQLAQSFYLYFESRDTKSALLTLIDDEQAAAMFRSVLLENHSGLQKFNSENILTRATSKEIFEKVNLLRGFGWTGKEDKTLDRVRDLNTLKSLYEQELNARDYLDNIALISHITEQLDASDDAQRDIRMCTGAKLSYLAEDFEKATQVEKNLLQKLGAEEVSLWEKNPGLESVGKPNQHFKFFKGYGSVNEANFVVNDIVSKDLPLGDVAVLYTDDAQVDALQSAFVGNGQAAAFVSNISLKSNPVIALARNILDWAANDFSETALEKIFASPILYNAYTDAERKEQNAISGKYYFSHVLDAKNRHNDSFTLGWGYARNREFIAHEGGLSGVTEKTKKALDIHEALLNIYGNAVLPGDCFVPGDIMEGIWNFAKDFTVKGLAVNTGKEALEKACKIAKMEKRQLKPDELLLYLDELLAGFAESQEESNEAVLVAKLSDWKNVERKHLYVIGLSLQEMQSASAESPILSDDELEEWLGKGWKPTLAAKAESKELAFFRTLEKFEGSCVTLGYSDYDTVQSQEKMPSVLFRNVLGKIKGIAGADEMEKELAELPEFVYGNPTADSKRMVTAKSKDSYPLLYKVDATSSNTSLEKLMDCPRKYYYAEIEHLPNNRYLEYDASKWLDAMHKGLLFHAVAEQYVNEQFIATPGAAFNQAKLEALVDQEANKLKGVYPAPSDAQIDYEIAKMKKTCVNFFTKMHKEFADPDNLWKVLFTEKRFDMLPFSVSDYEGVSYNFTVNGVIDRIDYYVNAQERTISVRTIDYKTGKQDTKKKDNDLGRVVQHVFYKKAIMNPLTAEIVNEVAEREGNPAIRNFTLDFKEFIYLFPYENKKDRITIFNPDIEGINMIRWRTILTAIQKLKEYPDHEMLVEEVGKYVSSYPSKADELNSLLKAVTDETGKMDPEEKASCRYCDYKNICKGGIL